MVGNFTHVMPPVCGFLENMYKMSVEVTNFFKAVSPVARVRGIADLQH